MSFKKCKVVMLPTKDKKAKLYTSDDESFMDNKPIYIKEPNGYHIYFTSDEEIEEGNWSIADEYAKPERAKVFDGIFVNGYIKSGCHKIIASTDPLLTSSHLPLREAYVGIPPKKEVVEFPNMNRLPSPSQSFIDKYIAEYNKGNVITEVMVEFEDKLLEPHIDKYGDLRNNKFVSVVKVNSKDNTIIIKKVKEFWNREEVVSLIEDAFHNGKLALIKPIDLRKWINDHL